MTAPMLFAQMPSTSNYQLRDYGIGSGGGVTGTSSYSLEGISGEQSGQPAATGTYGVQSGLFPVQNANLPPAPAFTNPANYYNKLRVVINTAGNPSDTLFALAISTDNFTTTRYVQSDTTVGDTLGIEDYQSYAAWGGASGFEVIGLESDTTYYLKATAMQGNFTESGFGPVASVATSQLLITFDIDVSAIDEATNPPYSVSFGNLLAGSVTNSPTYIWFTLDTNAAAGGKIYVLSDNGGLRSVAASHTITAVTGDLAAASEGFGAQAVTATAVTGTLSKLSPYDGAADNVGIIDSQYRAVFDAASPLSGGRASLVLKAKSNAMTPTGTDYADVYTAIAAPAF